MSYLFNPAFKQFAADWYLIAVVIFGFLTAYTYIGKYQVPKRRGIIMWQVQFFKAVIIAALVEGLWFNSFFPPEYLHSVNNWLCLFTSAYIGGMFGMCKQSDRLWRKEEDDLGWTVKQRYGNIS